MEELRMFKGEEMDEGMEGGSDIDSIMSEPIEGEEEEGMFGKEDPLEEALSSAGFNVTPDILEQVRALVSKPAGKPEAGAPPLAGKPEAPMGGAVPSGMKMGDLAR
jgi:hypothetical protein